MNRKVEAIRQAAIPLKQITTSSYAPILDAICNAQVVLIGESSHGTEEFYRYRAEITKALIEQKGFSLVLCEGDFPPFWQVNRALNGETNTDLHAAFNNFKARFPTWMWHNQTMLDFCTWVQHLNTNKSPRVSVLGMDIYSLYRSAQEVLAYLSHHDEELAALARTAYDTLGTFAPEPHAYAEALMRHRVSSQEKAVGKVLAATLAKEFELANLAGDGDEYFSAAENARVVKAAEEYYRKTFMGGSVTWSVRDKAMLESIVHSLGWQQKKLGDDGVAKAVVWAHNSHVGDAHYTQHREEGQFSLGQLVREHFGVDNTFIIGFSTNTGTVRAAKEWNGDDRVMSLLPSLPESAGHLLSHASIASLKNYGLLFRTNNTEEGLSDAQVMAKEVLDVEMLQRYIGVIYAKRAERHSHYTLGQMGSQYDFVIHLDETKALKRIDIEKKPVRPGTTDYSKWEHLEEYEEEDIDMEY